MLNAGVAEPANKHLTLPFILTPSNTRAYNFTVNTIYYLLYQFENDNAFEGCMTP